MNPPPAAASPDWFVYVLASAEKGATYVGVTTDVERRLGEHNGVLSGGARSTRSGRPWTVECVVGPLESRSAALKLEHRIKRERGAARRGALARDCQRQLGEGAAGEVASARAVDGESGGAADVGAVDGGAVDGGAVDVEKGGEARR